MLTRLRAQDHNVLRIFFVVAALFALLHIAGVALAVFGDPGLLVAALVLDGFFALFGGLAWCAVRLFPDAPKEG